MCFPRSEREPFPTSSTDTTQRYLPTDRLDQEKRLPSPVGLKGAIFRLEMCGFCIKWRVEGGMGDGEGGRDTRIRG